MPKPKHPNAAEATLFDDTKYTRRGAARRAIERDVKTLKQLEAVPAGSDALLQTARTLCDALDLATMRKDPYAVAAVARELRATLEMLRPESSPNDELDHFLDTLRTPLGDTPQS